MTKVMIHIMLLTMLMQSPPAAFAQYFHEKEHLLAESGDDTAKINLLLELGEFYVSRDFEKALLYLQEAFLLSTEHGNKEGIAASLLWQGRAYYYKDAYEIAFRYLERAGQMYYNLGSDIGLANYYFAKGAINRIIGNNLQALQDFQHMIGYSKLAESDDLLALGYLSLGSFYIDRAELSLARKYLHEALNISERIGDQTKSAIVLTNLGRSFTQIHAPDSALYFLEKGLEIRKALKQDRGIANSLYEMGKAYLIKKDPKQALDHFDASKDLYIALKDDTGICINLIALAEAYALSNNFTEARSLANESLSLADNLNNPKLKSTAYLSLANIEATNNNYEAAYAYALLHKNLEDSLAMANRERIIRELEVKFQSAQKDGEIALLTSQNELQKRNNQLLTISIGALIAVLLLTFILLRVKLAVASKQRKLYEHERTIGQQSAKLKEQEQQVLRHQLESKNRELASKALEMLRINETIGNIIEKLEQCSLESQGNSMMEKNIKDIIAGLETQLKNNSWNEFDSIFKQIHSDFYHKLLHICPDLSPAEIKVAAFLKLNLSTKEIAAITYKSESGVKSTRYRLRQKLGLQSDDSLIPYLIQL